MLLRAMIRTCIYQDRATIAARIRTQNRKAATEMPIDTVYSHG
jgi:hypothetical protein